jgi:hypothetical protein
MPRRDLQPIAAKRCFSPEGLGFNEATFSLENLDEMAETWKVDVPSPDPPRGSGPPFLEECHAGSPPAIADPVSDQDQGPGSCFGSKAAQQDFLLIDGKVVKNIKSTDNPSILQGEVQEIPFAQCHGASQNLGGSVAGSYFPTTKIATPVVDPLAMCVDPESKKSQSASHIDQGSLYSLNGTKGLFKNRITQELSLDVSPEPSASADRLRN